MILQAVSAPIANIHIKSTALYRLDFAFHKKMIKSELERHHFILRLIKRTCSQKVFKNYVEINLEITQKLPKVYFIRSILIVHTYPIHKSFSE